MAGNSHSASNEAEEIVFGRGLYKLDLIVDKAIESLKEAQFKTYKEVCTRVVKDIAYSDVPFANRTFYVFTEIYRDAILNAADKSNISAAIKMYFVERATTDIMKWIKYNLALQGVSPQGGVCKQWLTLFRHWSILIFFAQHHTSAAVSVVENLFDSEFVAIRNEYQKRMEQWETPFDWCIRDDILIGMGIESVTRLDLLCEFSPHQVKLINKCIKLRAEIDSLQNNASPSKFCFKPIKEKKEETKKVDKVYDEGDTKEPYQTRQKNKKSSGKWSRNVEMSAKRNILQLFNLIEYFTICITSMECHQILNVFAITLSFNRLN